MLLAEQDLRLDRIALEDAGANPERLAEAIHHQLGERAGPVPVHAIARALDIEEIREEALQGMEAALVTTPDRGYGAIVINALSSGPRRRFSVGHELGHFLNPWHKPTTGGRFECTRADMRLAVHRNTERSRHQVQEIEANRFAIELLTPRCRLRSHLAPEPDLRHALAMAAEFEISREAAARRYVALHRAPLAVVFSRENTFSYVDRSGNFPFIGLRKGDPMPELPRASGILSRSAMEEVDTVDWLAQPPAAWLYVQTLYQQNGYQMTLLLIETDRDDDGEDETDVFDRFTRFGTR